MNSYIFLFTFTLIFLIHSSSSLYFELKDGEDRCFYDDYYQMNVSIFSYLINF